MQPFCPQEKDRSAWCPTSLDARRGKLGRDKAQEAQMPTEPLRGPRQPSTLTERPRPGTAGTSEARAKLKLSRSQLDIAGRGPGHVPEVFSKLGVSQSPYGQDAQRNWSEISNVPSSIWDSSATDFVPSWPSSSGSPTHTTSTILGNPSGLWSTTTTPFSSSIWSSNLNNSLPFNTPAHHLPGIDLGSENTPSSPVTAPTVNNSEELGQPYNPWLIWSPAIGRRSSDPWPNVHYPSEN